MIKYYFTTEVCEMTSYHTVHAGKMQLPSSCFKV